MKDKLGNDCHCQTCRYFESKSDREGLCRRRPPQVLVVGGAYLEVAWPNVLNQDFCGCWSQKEIDWPGF